jgi:2-polyprenyl-3-methyl-5-hydroxy-6-metoxy-1,4-benzoquinol methylase
MSIIRNNCVICGGCLRHIYELNNVPITISCFTENNPQYETLSYSQCITCNTIQLDKLIPLNILYSKSHNTISVGKIWNGYFQLFGNTIQPYISNKNILEIGCPSGKIVSQVAQYNKWYIVEPNINKEIVFPENSICIETFFDDSFSLNDTIDIIIHSHLFEHIYEPNRFLKKCYEILNENGEMIFGVPNMQYMVDTTIFMGIMFEHTIFLNKEIIVYLLNTNEFEIVEIIDYLQHSTIYHTRKTQILPNKSPFQLTNYYSHFMNSIHEYNSFIQKCNYIIQNTNKNVYLFGASYNTQLLIPFGLDISSIKGIFDNCKEKQGKYLYGSNLIIYEPDRIQKEDCIIIVKNGYYTQEICEQIKEISSTNNIIQ